MVNVPTGRTIDVISNFEVYGCQFTAHVLYYISTVGIVTFAHVRTSNFEPMQSTLEITVNESLFS